MFRSAHNVTRAYARCARTVVNDASSHHPQREIPPKRTHQRRRVASRALTPVQTSRSAGMSNHAARPTRTEHAREQTINDMVTTTSIFAVPRVCRDLEPTARDAPEPDT